MAKVFVTGASGYMGQRLIPLLLKRGHTVRALARHKSADAIDKECELVIGNVLDSESYSNSMMGCDTLVHLVGVAHPSPSKAAEFRQVDLKSVEQAIPVAVQCGIQHVVYLSVAHPAPVMKIYWQCRAEAESLISKHFGRATFLRPWYVLGPGHRWAVITKPFYALAKLFSSTRETAQRMDLVTIEQMVQALVSAVENVPNAIRIVEVPEIQKVELVASSPLN